MSEESKEQYYIMTASNPDRMLLNSMPPLPRRLNDNWQNGQIFIADPKQPISVRIQEGNEKSTQLPFFDNPPVVSQEFLDALLEVGVDNIIAYDVVLKSSNGKTLIDGYKAINIIGLVKVAGPGTVFVGDSKLINASIDGLDIEPRSIKGLLMFRMAENTGYVVVHEKVKNHLESKGFHSLVFTESEDFFAI